MYVVLHLVDNGGHTLYLLYWLSIAFKHNYLFCVSKHKTVSLCSNKQKPKQSINTFFCKFSPFCNLEEKEKIKETSWHSGWMLSLQKIKSVLVVLRIILSTNSWEVSKRWLPKKLLIYVTGPTKIDHVSADYTELYFR